jgi:hypothetical protein
LRESYERAGEQRQNEKVCNTKHRVLRLLSTQLSKCGHDS